MKSFWKNFAVVLVMLLPIFNAEATWKERRSLKNICKDERKVCRADGGSYSECRKEWKSCRKELGVDFKSDMSFLQSETDKALKKAIGYVELEMGTDEELGEYLNLILRSKHLDKLVAFSYKPPKYDSYVELVENDEGAKELQFKIFTSDLEESAGGDLLQTSEGRSFPKFIDGRQFDELFGIKAPLGELGDVQFYMDSNEQVHGMFFPVPAFGELISKLNELKNGIKYVKDIVPDINSIPLPVKYAKTTIGKMYILSRDSEGKNAGFMFLVDHHKTVELIKSLEVEDEEEEEDD